MTRLPPPRWAPFHPFHCFIVCIANSTLRHVVNREVRSSKPQVVIIRRCMMQGGVQGSRWQERRSGRACFSPGAELESVPLPSTSSIPSAGASQAGAGMCLANVQFGKASCCLLQRRTPALAAAPCSRRSLPLAPGCLAQPGLVAAWWQPGGIASCAGGASHRLCMGLTPPLAAPHTGSSSASWKAVRNWLTMRRSGTVAAMPYSGALPSPPALGSCARVAGRPGRQAGRGGRQVGSVLGG